MIAHGRIEASSRAWDPGQDVSFFATTTGQPVQRERNLWPEELLWGRRTASGLGWAGLEHANGELLLLLGRARQQGSSTPPHLPSLLSPITCPAAPFTRSQQQQQQQRSYVVHSPAPTFSSAGMRDRV